MANWSLPTTASTYVNYTAELDARLDDLALGLDPAFVTTINVPLNTKRWNSVASYWERFNGTTWNPLATTYSINVTTANAWATARTISLTGDVTATSPSWTGSGNLSISTTLPTVNSNVGSFGSTSAVPVITVNGKGLVTAVSTVALGTLATQGAGAVAITGGSISGVDFTLKQSTTAAPTAEGRAEWDTDDDVLRIGTGAGTKTVVNTDNTQTLTNKTHGSGSTWNGNAVPVAFGGTGAADAANARANLGVSSMGTQDAAAVAITGGTISGTNITLVQSTTAAPTAEGRIEWDTDDDVLVLGTASGTRVQANTTSAQTLTNKTMGAGSTWQGNVIAAAYIATLNQSTTGNAATATALQTARTINGVSFNGTADITVTANTTNFITFNNSGSGAVSGSSFNGSAGRLISYNSIGAPSTSGANATGTWSISITGNAATVTNGVYTTGNQTIGGIKTFSNSLLIDKSTTVTVGSAGGSDQFMITNGGSGAALMSFHRSNSYAINLGLDTDNVFRLGGWSNGTNVFRWTSDTSGNFTAQGTVTGSSDERLKTNWRQLEPDFVSRLSDVKTGVYDRTDTGATQVGVSAQSLREVLPQAVLEDSDGYLSVGYGNAALAACVMLAKEVVALRKEIELLKGAK